MIISKKEAQRRILRDIRGAIVDNMFYQGQCLACHEVVELLAVILSNQLDIIRDNAPKQRID